MRNKMMAWMMVFAMVLSSINVMTFGQRVNAEETGVAEETGEEGTTETGSTEDSTQTDANTVEVTLDAGEGYFGTVESLEQERNNVTVNTTSFKEFCDSLESYQPTRDGYDFDKWCLKKDDGTLETIDENNFSNIADKSTLYASWNEKQITVSLNANGGYFESPSTEQKENVDVNITLFTKFCESLKGYQPTRDGYDFDKWCLKKDNDTLEIIDENNFRSIADKSTLYARWVENTKIDRKVQIQCANISYGEKLKPEFAEDMNTEEIDDNYQYLYKEQSATDAAYRELNDLKEPLNAGTYCIKAKVDETQNYKAATSNVVSVTVNKAVPKYNLPQSKNIRAHCGEKLSDVSLAVQNDNGHFEWKNPDKKLQEGSNKEYIKFIPNDTKNYTESKDILVQFEVIHDFTAKNCFEYEAETEPVVPKTDKKGKEVEAGKVGHRESYKCKGCGKQFDAKTKQEHDASWFVKPCYVKKLTVELGKTYSLKDFVKVGQEYVDTKSTAFKNQKYLKWDKNKGTLKAVKYYKKELKKNHTITFKDKKGDTHDVTINVTIAAPKVVKANKKFTKKTQGIQIKRKSIKISGRNYYKYTIKYNVKDAKSLKITASGFNSKNTQKTLNKLLAKRIKKGKGTYSFGVVKTAVKKKKITFKIVADYGNKNKSKSVSITE